MQKMYQRCAQQYKFVYNQRSFNTASKSILNNNTRSNHLQGQFSLNTKPVGATFIKLTKAS